jgi:hypothetical protein
MSIPIKAILIAASIATTTQGTLAAETAQICNVSGSYARQRCYGYFNYILIKVL